jgi:uncharacterized alkaline shock family protein YloU
MIEVARTTLGTVSLEPKALEQLVRHAAESVDGARVVRSGRGLEIAVGEDGAATVAVIVTAPRGAVLPELGRHVQVRISEALVDMLDAPPARVDVTVEGVRAEEAS